MQKSYESLFRISLLYQGFGVIRLIQYQKIDSKICMLICSWKRYFLQLFNPFHVNACQLILFILLMHNIMLQKTVILPDSVWLHLLCFCLLVLNLTLNFSDQITSNIDVYHLLVKTDNFFSSNFCKMIATEFMQRNVSLKT